MLAALEGFFGNSFTIAGIAIVGVIFGPKLVGSNAGLAIAWMLFGLAFYRLGAVSAQPLTPRLLLTMLFSALVGLALCYGSGWRPSAGGSKETHVRFGESGEYTIIFGDNATPLTPNVPVDLFGAEKGEIYIDGLENTKVGATLVDGEVLITAKLYAGMMGPVEIVNNELKHTNPSWDRNYDGTAFEVVNEKLEPRLQVIRATPHSWKVYGVFVSGKGGIIAGPGGLEFMAVFPDSLRIEHKLPRLFRYPSRKYQGLEVGDSLRGS